ncbi:MAG: hypothetical protein KF718_12800 [Polyangiaceae bacterium]|nr:hypothetical protein [Polyangiaceae bacterium]
MMGVLDLEGVFERTPKAYGVSVEPGTVTALRVALRHWRLGFRNVPNFIDSYHGAVPQVRVRLFALDVGALDVRWTTAG